MVLRFIVRLLVNNEHLIQRLSESYPMRRAAQLAVRAMFTGKNLIEESRLQEKLSSEQFKTLMRDVSMTFRKQIKEAHENYQRKMKQ